MSKTYKVVELKFNPSAVGVERLLPVMGKLVNVPQTTAATARMVKGKLSKSKAQSLADKLNDQQSVKEDLSVMLTYVVKEERHDQGSVAPLP
jgi:hypothetical protein